MITKMAQAQQVVRLQLWTGGLLLGTPGTLLNAFLHVPLYRTVLSVHADLLSGEMKA